MLFRNTTDAVWILIDRIETQNDLEHAGHQDRTTDYNGTRWFHAFP